VGEKEGKRLSETTKAYWCAEQRMARDPIRMIT
jgi:hypothetical protein